VPKLEPGKKEFGGSNHKPLQAWWPARYQLSAKPRGFQPVATRLVGVIMSISFKNSEGFDFQINKNGYLCFKFEESSSLLLTPAQFSALVSFVEKNKAEIVQKWNSGISVLEENGGE
jgi:hypothetical protein